MQIHVQHDGIVLTPRTSALAVWSLVLGILGILGILGMIPFGIPSIAAIICGHLSRRKIRKSGGLLEGKGIAMAGLILGYLGPLLIVAGFVAGNAAITKAKKTTTMATAIAIESAVNNFYMEYGEMPSVIEITDTSKDVSLVKTLRGDDPTRNTR
jgi:ABC-type thiamin/hydroxymethylpyrimidine transport system permease subunit